jgi:hypothetical protein
METQLPESMKRKILEIGGTITSRGQQRPRFRIIHASEVFELFDGKWIPKYWKSREKKIVAYWVMREVHKDIFIDPAITGNKKRRLRQRNPLSTPTELRMVQISESEIRPNEIVVPITDIVYETMDCFVLEQWLHESTYQGNWSVIKYDIVDGELVNRLGSEDEQSGYFHMYTFVDRKTGQPWLPGQRMLDFLQEKWNITQHDPVFKGWSPSDPVPAEAIAKAMKIDNEQRAIQAEKERQRRFDALMNIFQPYKKHLFHPNPNEGGGRLYVR